MTMALSLFVLPSRSREGERLLDWETAREVPWGMLLLFGGGFAAMAFSRSFWGVIPAGIGVGGVGFANIAIVTMRQQLSPPEMLGRVVAASRTISWSLIPLGAALGGALADAAGLLPVYAIGTAGVIATALIVMRTAVWSGAEVASNRN